MGNIASIKIGGCSSCEAHSLFHSPKKFFIRPFLSLFPVCFPAIIFVETEKHPRKQFSNRGRAKFKRQALIPLEKMMGNIKILSRHVNENKSLFKFSNKVKFYQVLLRLYPVCFPGFTSHEIGKISLKTIKRGCIKMVKCTPLFYFLPVLWWISQLMFAKSFNSVRGDG